jgi:hypothetical protein
MSPESNVEKLFAASTTNYDKDRGFSFGDIFEDYAQSLYGKHHASQPLRFGRYAYDRGKMWTDLGDDVHPVQHMPYTHRDITIPFIEQQISRGDHSELSTEDIKIIRITALVHDIGECTEPSLENDCGRTVGDITHDEKQTADEEDEATIRDHLYDQLFSFIEDKQLEKVEKIITLSDPTDYSTQLFRAVEDLGYYRTGIRAGERALELFFQKPEEITDLPERERTRLQQLGRMAANVPEDCRSTLEARADIFPYIETELADSNDIYTIIQNKRRALVVV